jgi:hypothetical protein
MDAPELNDVTAAARMLQRRLHELEETQHWVHHVGDLDSGELSTTRLDRPVSALSRAERVSRLGRPIAPSIFGGPAFRLTPRQPYQAAPEAWFRASGPSMYATDGNGVIMWTTPRDMGPGSDPDSMHFFFAESPVGRSLVSISLSAVAWPDNVGQLLVASIAASATLRVPIADAFADHTIDLAVTPQGGQMEAFLFIFDGIQHLLFRSLDFRPAPVLDRFAR